MEFIQGFISWLTKFIASLKLYIQLVQASSFVSLLFELPSYCSFVTDVVNQHGMVWIKLDLIQLNVKYWH